MALGINMVVGSGFFLFPAPIYTQVGPWAPALILLVGAGLVPIALCFAEAGSRFVSSGGPYLYVHAAFGRLAAFEVGWLLWISRVVSQAAVLSGLLLLLSALLGREISAASNAALSILITAVIAVFSIAGGRLNEAFINTLTIVKLAPVVALVAFGVGFLDFEHFTRVHPIGVPEVSAASLLILYSFAGFELLAIPAGEARSPSRDVPIALMIVLASASLLMALAHLIVIGTMDDPGSLRTALADTATHLWGPGGATILLSAALVAILGHNATSLLSASRLLYAVAEKGELPAICARLHPRSQTPWVAVLLSAGVVAALTVSRTFQWLVVLAAGTRILVYIAVIVAAWRLRVISAEAPPYAMPFPRTLSCLALLVCAALSLSIKPDQLVAIGAASAAGFAVYAWARQRSG